MTLCAAGTPCSVRKRTRMAEPAWVLRARRARVRRYRAQGISVFWSQRMPALVGWLRRFLPSWLFSRIRTPLLRLLPLIYARPALRAADIARATLDGLSVQDIDTWHRRLAQQQLAGAPQSRSFSGKAQSAARAPWISLRYAA